MRLVCETCLRVVRRVPIRVEEDHAGGGGEVDANAARLGGDEEEARARVVRVVEPVDPALAGRGLQEYGAGSKLRVSSRGGSRWKSVGVMEEPNNSSVCLWS